MKDSTCKVTRETQSNGDCLTEEVHKSLSSDIVSKKESVAEIKERQKEITNTIKQTLHDSLSMLKDGCENRKKNTTVEPFY